MQEVFSTKFNFVEKLKKLETFWAVDGNGLAAKLDITPQYLSQLRKGREPGEQLKMLVDLLVEKNETQFQQQPQPTSTTSAHAEAMEGVIRAIAAEEARREIGRTRKDTEEIQNALVVVLRAVLEAALETKEPAEQDRATYQLLRGAALELNEKGLL